MEQLRDRILTYIGHGLHCSQIMMLLSLEMRGLSNPELIRALGGLGGGMFCRRTCGTLTGGCCLLSSFGAKGSPEDEQTFDYEPLTEEFLKWFEEEFGSIECQDLVAFERDKILAFCPELIEKSFTKCMEIITAAGIDPYD